MAHTYAFVPVDAATEKTMARRSRPRRPSRLTRRARMLLVAPLIALIAALSILAGLPSGAGAAPANAGLGDLLCFYGTAADYKPQPAAWPGVVAGLGGFVRDASYVTGQAAVAGAATALTSPFMTPLAANTATNSSAEIINTAMKYLVPYGNVPVTGYEWYGTAGLSWATETYSELGATCPPFAAWGGNMIANLVFLVDQVIAEIGLSIFGWAMSLDAMAPFMDVLEVLLTKMKDMLLLNFLPVVLLLGALWMGWNGLVKKRSSEAVQGAVWMIFAAAAGIAFLSQPTYWAKAINGVVQEISVNIVNSMVGAVSGSSTAGPGNLCYLPSSVQMNGATVETPGRNWRIAQCQIWQTFVYSPWVSGSFGTVGSQGIPVDETWTSGEGWTADTGVTLPGWTSGGKTVTSYSLPLVYLDSRAYNHDQVVLGGGLSNLQNDIDALMGSGAFSAVTGPLGGWTSAVGSVLVSGSDEDIQKKTAQWHVVFDAVNPNDNGTPGPAAAAAPMFTGNEWTSRLTIAFVDLIAMFIGAVPILVLAFSLVIMQLGTVMLLLFSPIFLLLGVHPGAGRRIGLGWLEMLIGLSVKRVATAFMIGVVLAMFGAIIGSAGSWVFQIILLGASSIAMLMYRKKILDQVSQIKLGGNGAGMLSGGGMGGAKSKTKRSFARATGAVAGGSSSSTAGGNFLTGAALGAVMGRSGNPVMAWRIGSARGRAHAEKQRRKQAGADPLMSVDQVDRDRAETVKEDKAMTRLEGGDGNKSVREQAEMWQKRWKTFKRAAPMPGNPELKAELERLNVPMRERIVEAQTQLRDDIAKSIEDFVDEYPKYQGPPPDSDYDAAVEYLGYTEMREQAAADKGVRVPAWDSERTEAKNRVRLTYPQRDTGESAADYMRRKEMEFEEMSLELLDEDLAEIERIEDAQRKQADSRRRMRSSSHSPGGASSRRLSRPNQSPRRPGGDAE